MQSAPKTECSISVPHDVHHSADDPVKMPGIWLHYFAGEPPVTGETPPGLAAYAQEDGTYSACVILQKGRPPPTELAAWRAVLQDALQHSVPQVRQAVLIPESLS